MTLKAMITTVRGRCDESVVVSPRTAAAWRVSSATCTFGRKTWAMHRCGLEAGVSSWAEPETGDPSEARGGRRTDAARADGGHRAHARGAKDQHAKSVAPYADYSRAHGEVRHRATATLALRPSAHNPPALDGGGDASAHEVGRVPKDRRE